MTTESFNRDIDQLLIKCIEGSASNEELVLAWEWIQKNPVNKKHYENLREIWLSVSISQTTDEKQLENFWLKFKNKNIILQKEEISPDYAEPKPWVGRFIRVAAILIITLMLGAIIGKLVFTNKEPKQSNPFYVIEAPRGAKSFVTLTDGTKIWLNAGSRISYQRNYNQGNRNIFLEGEAFFDVAKNKDIPFYVYSSGIVVKAIGTAFNVKAYPEEGIVETTLVEGSVSIESIGKSGRKEQTLMQPKQKANFYKVSQNLVLESGIKKEEKAPAPEKTKIERIEVKKEIDTDLYTSWKDKRWIFEKEKLEDFAIILERIYDVKVIFRDEELKSYRLSGSLQEENLEQVLKAIQYTIPLDFNIEHNEVVLQINNKLKNQYQKILKKKNN